MYAFILILLSVICNIYGDQTLDQGTVNPCANSCLYQFRCTPYYNEPVWSLVDGQCEVFISGCIFGSKNCQRANNCLPPMIETTKEECQKFGPNCETSVRAQICAHFTSVAANGTNIDEYVTHQNMCFLMRYAVENAKPYFDFTDGPCI